jgi:hypothetical protein
MTRDIPLSVKRQLRQEAGFGCCFCGYPFIEYHHIVPFSECKRHDPRDMMVVCPTHHHQCSVNALAVDKQREAKVAPCNIARGYADGQLVIPTKTIAVQVGSTEFVGGGFKFAVDTEPLLSIRPDREGRLQITVDLFDETDGLLLALSENEWIAGDPLPWDIEYSFNYILLRHRERKISLEVDARAPLVNIKGELWRKGQKFSLRNDGLYFDGVVTNVSVRDIALVAMSLMANTDTRQFSIVPDKRLGSGLFVSRSDPEERLRQAVDGFDKLCREAKIGRNEPCPCGSGRKAKRCHQAPPAKV